MAKSAKSRHARQGSKSSHSQTLAEFRKAKTSEAKEERKASQISLDRQLYWPVYILGALLVCHALSGTSSLSLSHLSAHLPYSIQKLFPTWARRIPNLAPFASDVPNASHDSKTAIMGSWHNLVVGQAGPFRSDAAGFGHPLSALHKFTRACLGLSYALPTPSRNTDDALHTAAQAAGLSFLTPQTEPWAWLIGTPGSFYAKGLKDALYVCTWILIWTALRAAVIRYALVPLGCRWTAKPLPPRQGETRSGSRQLRKTKQWEKNVTRFAEQSWSVIFYVIYWSLGLHIAYHSPYWLNTSGFWADHPHTQLEGIVKFYYLTQCGFWFHQLIVINVEARRKDHWQMFSHHIITILLIVGSYCTHFTRVGNAVLCLMDPSDILLSAAKCLRYCGLQTLCDAAFGAFMLSWMLTRHIMYICVVWACITVGVPRSRYEAASKLSSAAVQAGQTPQFGKLSLRQWWQEALPASLTLTALLCALQVILLIWFGMIMRIAYRVISGSGAADTRSDEELSEEDEQAIARVEREEQQSSDASKAAGKNFSNSTSDHRESTLSPSAVASSASTTAKGPSKSNAKRRK